MWGHTGAVCLAYASSDVELPQCEVQCWNDLSLCHLLFCPPGVRAICNVDNIIGVTTGQWESDIRDTVGDGEWRGTP